MGFLSRLLEGNPVEQWTQLSDEAVSAQCGARTNSFSNFNRAMSCKEKVESTTKQVIYVYGEPNYDEVNYVLKEFKDCVAGYRTDRRVLAESCALGLTSTTGDQYASITLGDGDSYIVQKSE